MIYGAIIGDVVGSRFEHDKGTKTKRFDLFSSNCKFTDDTVLTIAVANAIMDYYETISKSILSESNITDNYKRIIKLVIDNLKKFGNLYLNVGYGKGFKSWLNDPLSNPYNSYGNGSAMRCSICGWICDSIESTKLLAELTAIVTHNHPEGIKGAQAVATAIYMARNAYSKNDIKNYIQKEFNYNLDRTLAEIRPTYSHKSSCQESVPEAIICFLESKDFEDAIRNALSIGGDTDTIACIAGSIAEAFGHVPYKFIIESSKYLDINLNNALMSIECRNPNYNIKKYKY